MNLEDLSLSYTLPSELMYYPGGKKDKKQTDLICVFPSWLPHGGYGEPPLIVITKSTFPNILTQSLEIKLHFISIMGPPTQSNFPV